VRRAAEDDQVDLARLAALPQRAGAAGAMDAVAVEFNLARQSSVCTLLAVHEQHAGHRLENPAERRDSWAGSGALEPNLNRRARGNNRGFDPRPPLLALLEGWVAR
jgi:hypothetical protein